MDPHPSIWEHCLDTAADSNIGLRRGNNQDSMAVVLANSQEEWVHRGHLFMVADGMGAHAAGELASKLATDTVPLVYHKLTDRPAIEALAAAVRDANHQIHTRGSASEDFRGMGTTVTCLSVLPQGAVVAHVGDSRAYRLRGPRIEQLTFDHSLVWELRAAGQIPNKETQAYIPKNIITRSLGPHPDVQVDIEGPFPLELGDTFLLCSDGLSGQIKDEEIGKILAVLPPKEAVRSLVDLANLRGGPDNITVVVARVTGGQVAKGHGAKGQPAASSGAPESRPARSLPVGVWVALGLLTLAGLGLAVMGSVLGALASLAAVAITAVVAILLRSGDSEQQAAIAPLGKAPYGTWDSTPDLAFVSVLAKLAQQLRDAAGQAEWRIEWTKFLEHEGRATTAARGNNYSDAVAEYCRAISFLMDQLRHQRNRS